MGPHESCGINRLTVVSYLIQNAVVRANRYLEALHEHRYLENSKILEKDAFTQLVAAFFEAKRNGLTECSLVRIVCSSEDYKKAGEILEKTASDGLYRDPGWRAACIAFQYR